MSRILILTYRMAHGYGVDVMVAEHAKYLAKKGHQVTIGCIDKDTTYSNLNIVAVAPNLKSVQYLVEILQPQIIFAHTSPFFEMLPSFSDTHKCWAVEAGDPTPSLFENDYEQRLQIKNHKENNVYPHITGVISISDFISSDIHWDQAIKITLGHEHLVNNSPPLKPKNRNEILVSKKLKIGTLMRLGKGEAQYKGNHYYTTLVKRLTHAYPNLFEFHFMGRGSAQEAQPFTELGIKAHLNSSNQERDSYLRNLDLFVSFSLWEGFNLPLLEAQIAGTPAVAFDTGAHPEVTPLIMDNLFDLETFAVSMANNPEILWTHSQNAFQWSRQRFSWKHSLQKLDSIAKLSDPNSTLKPAGIGLLPKARILSDRIQWALKTYGFTRLTGKILRRVMRRLIRA